MGLIKKDKSILDTEDNLHILGVVKNGAVRAELLDIFEHIPKVSSNIIIGDFISAYDDVCACQQNSIILLEVDENDKNIAEAVQRYKEACGGKQHRLIIIYNGLNDNDILHLLHAGVSDFLSLPLTAEETEQSILRLVTPRHHDTAFGGDSANHKIISFVHASGGVGTTTLAVNAAMLLNAKNMQNRHSACLVDLDTQFGGAALHLDLPALSPVADLIGDPDHLDHEMLECMMVRHSSGLPVLTAPDVPFPIEAIGSDVIERALHLLKQRYEHSIIDMPLALTSWTDTVLENSDVVYAVMQLNVPSIKQLRRWFSMLEVEGLSDLPVNVIANRHHYLGHFRQDNISIAQASESLGRDIDYTVSNDYDLVSHSLDQGIPAAQMNTKSKFVQEIKALLQDVATSAEQHSKIKFLS